MRPPSRRYFREEVTVEKYLGRGARGSTYDPPVSVLAAIDDRSKVVRRGNGDEVTTELTVVLPPQATQPGTEVRLDAAQLLAEETRVTVRGETATVLAVRRITERGRLLLIEASIG